MRITKDRIAELAIVALVAYFAGRLVLYATFVSHYVPPDEVSHFGFCRVFSKAWWLPTDSDESYAYGLVTHGSYLYFFIMGKLLHTNVFGLPDLVFLRLVNAALCVGTVGVGYRWFRLVTGDRTMHIFFVVLLTNTPMFVMNGAAVTYDNLVNLLAVSSLYFLHRFLCDRQVRPLLVLVVCLLAGSLSKTAFLPLALLFLLVLGARSLQNLPRMRASFADAPGRMNAPDWALTGLAILLFALNVDLYLGNVVRFGALVPKAHQVISFEKAMKFRVYAQETIPRLYEEGVLSWPQAMAMANRIDHPGDRATTLGFLELARRNKEYGLPHLSRFQYIIPWVSVMVARTYGIFGHIALPKEPRELLAYQLVLLLFVLLFVRRWRPLDAGGKMTDAALLWSAYALVLMQFVSYTWYLRQHALGACIQGKYFFPVIVPFYAMVSYYCLGRLSTVARVALAVTVGGLYLWGDLPYFLMHVDSPWLATGYP